MAAPPAPDDAGLLVFAKWLWQWSGYGAAAMVGFFWGKLGCRLDRMTDDRKEKD